MVHCWSPIKIKFNRRKSYLFWGLKFFTSKLHWEALYIFLGLIFRSKLFFSVAINIYVVFILCFFGIFILPLFFLHCIFIKSIAKSYSAFVLLEFWPICESVSWTNCDHVFQTFYGKLIKFLSGGCSFIFIFFFVFLQTLTKVLSIVSLFLSFSGRKSSLN